jgi:hypothetical protein
MWNAIGGVVIIAYNAVAGIAIFSLLKVLYQSRFLVLLKI